MVGHQADNLLIRTDAAQLACSVERVKPEAVEGSTSLRARPSAGRNQVRQAGRRQRSRTENTSAATSGEPDGFLDAHGHERRLVPG